MTRRSSTRKRSRRQSASSSTLSRYFTFAVLAGFAIFAVVFLLTGSDPLGVFSRTTPTPLPLTIGSGGGWWQVFFTDPRTVSDPANIRGSVAEQLVRRIDEAQSSVHIAAFEFDLAPVADALIAAHERGVEVKWITDDENGIETDEEEGRNLFPTLERAGVEVKDDGRSGLMHNKFWIFDDRTVWTGSYNATANGTFRNNNNVLVINSPEVAAIYEREFHELWDGAFGPTSPSTVDEQGIHIDDSSLQILFAAEDGVVRHLIRLIEGAQDSIRFMAFSFTHDELAEALIARADVGVEVKGILETRGSETEYSELKRLYCAGLPVRQDGNPGALHHKVLITDDEIVVTGSLNFSASADETNDENVLVVGNTGIAAQYSEEFERRWAEANDPDAGDVDCD
jgi:phosphatidylserine/phosphatidylglycerophosphate/cardiolipin synthase-like enzyme